jgi:hypothetical protein
VNIFVAVVLKQFEEEIIAEAKEQSSEAVLTRRHVTEFGKVWSEHALKGTSHLMHIERFVKEFLPALGQNDPWNQVLGGCTARQDRLKLLEKLRCGGPKSHLEANNLEMPVIDGNIHYLDCLLRLATVLLSARRQPGEAEILSIPESNEMHKAIKAEVFRRYPTLYKNRLYKDFNTVSQYYYALLLQKNFRGYSYRKVAAQNMEKEEKEIFVRSVQARGRASCAVCLSVTERAFERTNVTWCDVM